MRISDWSSDVCSSDLYTADTLKALTQRLPRVRFVWLMGADNLIQVHQWQDWRHIFMRLPVAVFDRPTYSLGALSSKAAPAFARHRTNARAATSEAHPSQLQSLMLNSCPAFCTQTHTSYKSRTEHIHSRHPHDNDTTNKESM